MSALLRLLQIYSCPFAVYIRVNLRSSAVEFFPICGPFFLDLLKN